MKNEPDLNISETQVQITRSKRSPLKSIRNNEKQNEKKSKLMNQAST